MRLKGGRILASGVVALCMAPAVASSENTDPAPETAKTIPGISMSADLFTQFCIDQSADISALIDLLPENGYVWMPDSKRFVHPTHDVSFALLQSELGFACSMQFANHVDPATSAAIFIKKTSSREVTVNVGFPDDTSNRNYVQASVAAEANLTQ
ncbi:MAG: hypothetical protein AAFO72_03680 [Pseudomonadota bacterium]